MKTGIAFTDDDLENIKNADRPIELTATSDDGWITLFDTEKVEALLARLEAAETIIDYLPRMAAARADPLKKDLQTWRMAAGLTKPKTAPRGGPE